VTDDERESPAAGGGRTPPEAAEGEPDAGGRRHVGMQDRLDRLERLIDPGLNLLERVSDGVVAPAWRRVTQGEPRWPVSVAILCAIGMQVALPTQVAVKPRGLVPVVELLFLAGLFVANPRRLNRQSTVLRVASTVLIVVMSLANALSAGRLIDQLLRGVLALSPGALLATGGAIWATNVIVFALWYWELDRGGPVARAHATRVHPDFLFAQLQSPELASADWEPAFADYLYVSFTNAAAFSPTDTMPLSVWAKMLMLVESAISLALAVMVVARAVNILHVKVK